MPIGKTNATRILDTLGIRYELREYPVDPQHVSADVVAAGKPMTKEELAFAARRLKLVDIGTAPTRLLGFPAP